MREASNRRTVTDTDSCAFLFLILSRQREDDRGGHQRNMTNFLQRCSLFLLFFIACAGGMKGQDNIEDLLTFTEVDDGYSVSKKEGATITGVLTIPRYYQSKPVVQIGTTAFKDCQGLTSVIISAPVKSIGEGAFRNCRRLTSVTMASTVASIGKYAFSGCEKLERVQIPQNVKNIEEATFEDCTNLRKVIFPNSLKGIGWRAFSRCANLDDFIIPDSLIYISAGGFNGCQTIPEIVLPENFTELGDDAFSNTRIPKFHISDKLKLPNLSIYSHPFENTVVGEFTASDNCENYSVYGSHLYSKDFSKLVCAAGMDSISITNLHPRLTTITSYALSGCEDAVVLTLPANVTDISSDFLFMPNLKTIIFESVVPPAISTETSNYKDRISLYVPMEAVNAYKSSAGWCELPIQGYMPGYKFEAANVVAHPGDEGILEIGMINEKEISSFQCDITLPDGLKVAENSKGQLDISLSERKGDQIISSKILSNGKLRVVSYSMSADIFEGNEGPLFRVRFDLRNSVSQNHVITIDNIHLSTPQGSDIGLRPLTVAFMIDNIGDTNDDGELTITDGVGIVNHLLEVEQEGFFVDRADVNNDGIVTISDATQIVYNILGKSSVTLAKSNQLRVSSREVESGDYMSMADLTISKGETVPFAINLNNQQTFTAFQCDIVLPDGLSIPKNSRGKPIIELTDRADESHILSCSQVSEHVVRVAVISTMSEDFTGDNGPILQFNIVCDEEPAAGAKIIVEDIHCTHNPGPIDVKLPVAECSVNAGIGTGISEIQTVDESSEIYSVQGLQLSTDISDLTPGIYIIRKNGISRKLLVR